MRNTKLSRIADAIEYARDAYELADDLGLVDRLATWWLSRKRVKIRRARRDKRRQQ